MVDTLQQSHQDLLVKQQTEERLRLTIESVAEGIASTDLEGNITDGTIQKSGSTVTRKKKSLW